MRILALDHGTVRIGVAISDELKMMAHPMDFIPAEPLPAALDQVKALVLEKTVEQIVVGMPRNMDGSYGDSAARVREFVGVLKEAVGVPVRTWDERLTTVSAARALRQGGGKKSEYRQKIDSTSAAILLQGYLDSLPPG